MEKIKKHFVDEIIANYKGHNYIVRLLRLGHRCGYVQVNDKNIFTKISECLNNLYDPDNKYNIECHGGITFKNSSPETQCQMPGHNWIGFDCNHSGDIPDITAVLMKFEDIEDKRISYMVDNVRSFAKYGYEVRFADYVENNCKSIIDQLVKLGDPEVTR